MPSLTAAIAFVALANLSAHTAQAAQSSASATAAYPLHDALINYRKSAHSYTISSINSGGHKITLSWQETPGPQSVFEGKAAYTYDALYTTSIDGKKVAVAKDIQYYAVTNNELLGSSMTSSNKSGTTTHYSIATSDQPLPMTAHIGQSGPNGSLVSFSDAKKSQVMDQRQATWALQADPASKNDALFCVREILMRPVSHDVQQTSIECYHEDTDGNFSAPIELEQVSTTFH